jgi:hypothetical protein
VGRLAEAGEHLFDDEVHLLVHLLATDAGEVEEEADVLEVEQVAPEADRVDGVVDRADDLELLAVALLDGGHVVERDLRAVGVAVAVEATVGREELDELVVTGLAAAHGLFAGAADVHVEHEAAVLAGADRGADLLADLGVAVPLLLLALGVGEPVHGLVAGAGDVLDRLGRRDGLVDVDGAQRLRDHREVLHGGAAVGHVVGREHELLAPVAERLLVPGELDDLHRLFEPLAVDAVVLGRHRVVAAGDDGAERPGLAGHGAAADAELHASTRDDVGEGEVLGEAQRVPLRHDVEHLAEAQVLGDAGQVLAEHDQVREDLVALVLEVVLGEPHRVEAERVGGLGPLDEVLVAGDDRVVAVAPAGGRDGGVAGIGHGHGAEEVGVDAHGR